MKGLEIWHYVDFAGVQHQPFEVGSPVLLQ